MKTKSLLILFIIILCKINILLSLDQNTVADESYEYFNKAFLILKGSGGEDNNNSYYRTDLSTTHWLYFWQQALVVLMVCDRYEFRGDTDVKSLINDVTYAFFEHERSSANWRDARQNQDFARIAQENQLSDWTWNDYNDDLLWAGLMFIRAYLITENKLYLEQAKWDWDLLYSRGWSDDLGGGIWWSVKKEEKSGLSNNPAVCMACYLYEATGDEKYLEQAKKIYDWIKSKLYNNDGSVDERITADGSLPHAYNVYNQGTFIEGASLLYKITSDQKYLEDAQKTIEYVMVNLVTNDGIMSRWKVDGTWQSEFARGIARLLQIEPKLWKYEGVYTNEKKKITYFDWMRLNADAAWNTRDKVNNISGCKWDEQTPTYPSEGKTWESDACVSSVVMTNVTPEKIP